jgi:hypothetical protein
MTKKRRKMGKIEVGDDSSCDQSARLEIQSQEGLAYSVTVRV